MTDAAHAGLLPERAPRASVAKATSAATGHALVHGHQAGIHHLHAGPRTAQRARAGAGTGHQQQSTTDPHGSITSAHNSRAAGAMIVVQMNSSTTGLIAMSSRKSSRRSEAGSGASLARGCSCSQTLSCHPHLARLQRASCPGPQQVSEAVRLALASSVSTQQCMLSGTHSKSHHRSSWWLMLSC